METHLKEIMVTIDQSHWRILELINIYQQKFHLKEINSFIQLVCCTGYVYTV